VNELPIAQLQTTQSIRLFKNGLGFKYVGAIHNQLTYRGDVCDVGTIMSIRHLGYNLSPEKMLKKFENRIWILEKEVKKNPEDPIARHHLAKMLLQGGETPNARTEAAMAIALLRRKKFVFSGTPFEELFQIAGMEKGAGE
jgi:hypothetical protein